MGCLFSPDDNSNYRIEVGNNSDQIATLRYFSYFQSGSKNYVAKYLAPHESVEISVCGTFIDDDYIEASVGGTSKQFHFEPDFWGHDQIFLESADFR